VYAYAATDGDWPMVSNVDRQPLQASVDRLVQALDSVGRPLSKLQETELAQLVQSADDAKVVAGIQQLLDPLCLAGIEINAESRVKVSEGTTGKLLDQNGWQTFLVKVHNQAGINPPLACSSPQALAQFVVSDSSPEPQMAISPADVKDRWLDIALPTTQPMKPTLSGLLLEYRIIQLYSRDAGKREATLKFNIGQGTQDLGFRNELAILFDCLPGRKVTVAVRDADPGNTEPMMVCLEIRDLLGRVYPNPARRLAPDFFFHNQIYRKAGETLTLPDGTFNIKISRGPEYIPVQQQIMVGENQPNIISAELNRWIDPVKWQWYSGDHHIHAAGCSHYQNPTQGVGPDDMMRHVLGEDLKVGCVLSWGPCWYTQKENFEGKDSSLSTSTNLLRYDIEVSGFPSSHAGHLCLLRLSEDDYPGTNRLEQWPTWTLPVLQWGIRQGGVVGYSHSGWGLMLPDYLPNGQRTTVGNNQFGQAGGGRAADTLPDYAMPNFDGIGANEYIVAAAHDACDFISTVDTPAIWELNIWYHTLNCGFRTKISGETDFPCIYGDRVGLGRVYVQLPPDQKLDFDSWIDGLKNGRSYCGDGNSHVLQFSASAPPKVPTASEKSLSQVTKIVKPETVQMGWPGSQGKGSQLNLAAPGNVTFSTKISALLEPTSTPQTQSIRNRRLDTKPYWHIERCRIDETRKVEAELIVNGHAVASQQILADGSLHDLQWNVDIPHSSWAAVRILPSVHSNPIFIEVAGQPIRSSRKSAQWCRQAVDVCWNSKQSQIRDSEQAEAKAAYDQAAKIYEEIISQAIED